MNNNKLNQLLNHLNKGFTLYSETIDKALDIASSMAKNSEIAVNCLNSKAVRKSAPYIVGISAYVNLKLLIYLLTKKGREE